MARASSSLNSLVCLLFVMSSVCPLYGALKRTIAAVYGDQSPSTGVGGRARSKKVQLEKGESELPASESKSVVESCTVAAYIFNSIPRHCLIMPICQIIADYTKEWKFRRRLAVLYGTSGIRDIVCLGGVGNPQDTRMMINGLVTNIWLCDSRTGESCEMPFKMVGSPAYAAKKELLITSPLGGVITLCNFRGVTVKGLIESGSLRSRCTLVQNTGEALVHRPAISPDESLFAVGFCDGTVKVWSLLEADSPYGAPRVRLLHTFQDDGCISRLSWNYDGTLLAVLSVGSFQISLWRRTEQGMRKERAIPVQAPTSIINIQDMICNPRYNNIVIKTNERLSAFDLLSGNPCWSIVIDDKFGGRVAFSPSGAYIASAAGYSELSAKIDLWDATTGKCLKSFSDNDPWGGVAFLSDDQLIIASDPSISKTRYLDIWYND